MVTPNQNQIPEDQYWASLPADQLASAMMVKITEWRNFAKSKGFTGLWMNKLSNYYGISANGNSSQQIIQGGSEGELSLIKVNDLHQLLQAQLVLVTSQRPAGIAKAINSNTAALKAARIGTAISEYYLANLGLEGKFVQQTELALLCDEAFCDLFWDKKGGEPLMPNEDMTDAEMTGDVVVRIHAPWNVTRDPGAPINHQKWYILSYPINKWDAVAAYPKFREQILNSQGDDLPELPMVQTPEGSDMTFAHLLVHDRTAALQDGRYAIMIGGALVFDNLSEHGSPELPYEEFPVERISPSDVIDGCVGYSAANDIMGLEQVTDALNSIVVTNNTTFGGQNIVVPQGSNLNVSDLGKGMRMFEVMPDMVDKILPLQLTKSAPETYELIDRFDRKKEQQTGNASGVIAQQAVEGASGSAMALVQAQSIQYNSGIQRSYFRLLSSAMTKLIGVLRKYADTPRVARIVGKSKAQGLKEFKYTGQDLSAISSIVYEMVNPISQTQGGRLQMAQDLLSAGILKNPKQYITLATTGSLESLTEDDEADQLLILEENEGLTEGRPAKAVITEMHADHIRSHMSVLSSQNAKQDPTLVTLTLSHIQEHIDLWMQASMTNPGLLLATNQQPLMGQPGMMMQPGAPGGDPGQTVGGGEPPAETAAQEVRQPSMPNNPATGEPQQVPGANMMQ